MTASAFELTPEMQTIESTIEAMGTKVLWSKGHSSCNKKGHTLFGYFSPRWNRIVMCDASRTKSSRAELVDTLKHEGWHAAQHNCNNFRPVLSDAQIRKGLSRKDRTAVRELYPVRQHRAEAEARAVAKLPTAVYLRGFRKVCHV